MSRWEGKELLQPITPEQPCGQNLEDSPLLASLDGWRLFGLQKPPESPLEQGESRKLPIWDEIRDEAVEALGKSKDLRLLAYLGTALLRIDGEGLPAFSGTLTIASQWLQTYWQQTFPPLDDDAISRRSALNCFADPMAVVDRVRRIPLVQSRQHGTYSLRDIDGEPKPDQKQVEAAFAEMPLDELMAVHGSVAAARAALQSMDAKMREEAGPEAAPTFDPLSTQLLKIDRLLREQLAARPDASPVAANTPEAAVTAVRSQAVGAIQSRQDAIRALDAVAEFFRKTEPSSPVPMFLERAKRLVSKDFLEVLADIAPDALAQARAAGGLRQE